MKSTDYPPPFYMNKWVEEAYVCPICLGGISVIITREPDPFVTSMRWKWRCKHEDVWLSRNCGEWFEEVGSPTLPEKPEHSP